MFLSYLNALFWKCQLVNKIIRLKSVIERLKFLKLFKRIEYSHETETINSQNKLSKMTIYPHRIRSWGKMTNNLIFLFNFQTKHKVYVVNCYFTQLTLRVQGFRFMRVEEINDSIGFHKKKTYNLNSLMKKFHQKFENLLQFLINID